MCNIIKLYRHGKKLQNTPHKKLMFCEHLPPTEDAERSPMEMCLPGAVANVTDSDRCCNPKVPSSIHAGGKDFP